MLILVSTTGITHQEGPPIMTINTTTVLGLMAAMLTGLVVEVEVNA